jgi:hypothetical protein
MSSRALALAFTAALLLGACADFVRGDPLPDGGTSARGASDGGGSDGSAVSFAADVQPLLASGCASCHTASGAAGSTAFVLSGDAAADFTEASSFIDLSNPTQSRLVRKAAGLGHGGGAIYAEGSPEHQTLAAWISGGALP